MLLLDKPAGYSSNQALGRVKRLLGIRKAGHTGTLDPFATGLLPIVVGEAAKFARFLIDSDKGYQATLRLGYTSTTGDVEGGITNLEPQLPKLEEVKRMMAEFLGVQMQCPPMHSAVRIQGRRLYDLARAGVAVDRPSRKVVINSLDLESFVGENLTISVNCSKGTYIRVLAADLGARLGCGAYLTALRRTATGSFRVEQSITLEGLERVGPEAGRAALLPVATLVSGLPQVQLDRQAATALSHGRRPPAPADAPSGEVAMHGPNGWFLGVAQAQAGAWVAVRLMGDEPHVAP